jgi:predicted P-loop ATPase
MMASNVTPLNAWLGRVQKDGRGKPRRNLYNLLLFLRESPGLGRTLRYNDFSGRVEWNGKPLADEDIIDIRLIIEEAGAQLGFDPSKDDVRPAVARHALENRFDPVRDYLDGSTWDKRPRLDTWLRDFMGAPEHEMIAIFGSKFLIGAVARIYEPGCQMDNMLVFEGKQGAGKTTAVSALFGRDMMISSISDFKTKESSIAIQGRWVVEVAELAALKKTDITDIKRFLTETVDQYRPTYGNNMVDRPRRCVFIGTTNEHQYLKDATGNRRFWPVPCGDVRVADLAAVRDQIWAEAVSRYRSGEKWWLTDAEHVARAEALQGDRAEGDTWADVIDRWLADPEVIGHEFMSVGVILSEAIKMPIDRQGKLDEMRVSNHLTKRGWTRVKKRLTKNAPPVWCWKRPEVKA